MLKLLGMIRGLGPMAYIIAGMGSIILTMTAALWLKAKTIEDLQVAVYKREQVAVQCIQANRNNAQVFEQLLLELQKCKSLRSAAEDRGNKAIEELAKARRSAYMASVQKKEQVNEAIAENPDTSCNDVPLPPRATGLLIAAANSANGDQGSTTP